MTSLWLLALASVGLLVGPIASAVGARIRSLLAWLDGFALVLVGGVCLIFVLPHAVEELGIVAFSVGFAIVAGVRAAGASLRVTRWLTLAMVGLTIVGYAVGHGAVAALPDATPVVVEALVAGMLLHVVFSAHDASASCHHEHGHGHGHEHGHEHGHASGTRWSAVGALCGLGAMAFAIHFASPHDLDHGASEVLRTFLILLLESAPALLIGYVLAGIVPVLLTPSRTSSLSRGGRLMQSLRGVLFGLPLPVCSCGVLPLYQSLIRRGVPAAAAMAFFVATPELGLDAVLLSFPLLGSSLTIARVVAAFAVALLVGVLLGGAPTRSPASGAPSTQVPPTGSLRERLTAGMRFGTAEVFDHTMPWIALGLFVAALAEPLLSHTALASIPPALQVPSAALVGVPVYVCASGATPVAALAMHKGLSSGAAVAFLIAGPATNITTFGLLVALHGRRTAILFGIGVTVLAMIAGWLVNAFGITAVPVLEARAHDTHGSWIAWACAGVLGLLTVASLFRQGPRGALRQIWEPIHTH